MTNTKSESKQWYEFAKSFREGLLKGLTEPTKTEPMRGTIDKGKVLDILIKHDNEICSDTFDEMWKEVDALPFIEPTTADTLTEIRAEIEPKCDRIHNLISVYPHAERRDIQELLCEIMDLCDAESEHKRMIDADELLKRIAEKCKTPSLSEDTVNGLCGATAIIYDMLIESGQEKDTDKESK